MWSSKFKFFWMLVLIIYLDTGDGHWWPESYYLGILQAREALYEVGATVTANKNHLVFTKKQVLSEQVGRDELTEREAVRIVENALYNTAARMYSLAGV